MKNKKKSIIMWIICALGIVIIGYSRYIDLIDNSDVISFVGSILGAFIGVVGAVSVVYKGKEIEKNRDIKKLIEMFKHTYIWVYPRYYLGARQYYKKFNEPIVPLIYDENWKSYITELENSHHKRFLLNWFYTLESLDQKKYFIGKIKENHMLEAVNILKYYNLYDDEVRNIEKLMYLEGNQQLRKELLDDIEYMNNLIEMAMESDEESYRLYCEENDTEEDEEYHCQEEIVDHFITKKIKTFEMEMRDKDSIYDFR